MSSLISDIFRTGLRTTDVAFADNLLPLGAVVATPKLKNCFLLILSNYFQVNFVMSLDCDSLRLKTAIEQAQFRKYSEDSKKIAAEQADAIDLISPVRMVFITGIQSFCSKDCCNVGGII